MIQMKINWISLLVWLSFPNWVSSQTQYQTLSSCLAQAKSYAPSIFAAKQQAHVFSLLKQSSFTVGITSASLLYGQYNGPSIDQNITISQTIPLTGILNRQKQVYQALENQAHNQELLDWLQWKQYVRESYLNAQFAQALISQLERLNAVLDTALQGAILRRKVGESSVFDSIAFASRKQLLNQRIEKMKANLQAESFRLQILTGATSPILPSESLNSQITSLNLDSAAWKRHPQLQFLASQIEINQAQKQVEKTSGLPELMFGYFNQSLVGTYEINGERVSYSSGKRFQGLQVGLSVPLWQRSIAKRIAAANQQILVAQNRLAAEMSLRKAQYLALLTEYQKQISLVQQFQQELLPQAEQLQFVGRQSYAVGEISYSEFFLLWNQASEIQLAYLDAVYQAKLLSNQLLTFVSNE
ncbi:MAG: TolC family protein [Bacteroidia bacterium]|nr:TolC family protein [Bacteroidia bacterium]